MKKNIYVSNAKYGANFEKKISDILTDYGVQNKHEQTITNGRKRTRDKGSDFEILIDGKKIYLELKSTTSAQSIDYTLIDDFKIHKLKHHQICKMDWLLVEYRDKEEMYLIEKHDFLKWACEQKKNSLSYRNCAEIGIKIDCGDTLIKALKKEP